MDDDDDLLLVDRMQFGTSAGSVVLGVLGAALAVQLCVVGGMVNALRSAGRRMARREPGRSEPDAVPATGAPRVPRAA